MRYLFLLCLPILAIGCKKNEFNLEFELKSDITENYNVTYYATDHAGGLTVQAVASVRDGKCELRGVTKHPTLLYITERVSKLPLIVYADRGDKIKITGENHDPLGWTVEGNKINVSLSNWRLENIENLSSGKTDSINSVIAKFADENKENPVSTILMLGYYNRENDETGYTKLISSLKGKARDMKWLELAARSDQMVHSYSYPARLESLVMRSINNGTDTLRLKKDQPVFIAFWQTGLTEKKNIIDSLKNLEKEYPDSLLLVSDVCLDVDSAAWRSATRKDSLKNIKRFWAPLALNDPTVAKLKVKAIPYFIVFDKEGEQTYRGKDLTEALKAYRQMMKKQ